MNVSSKFGVIERNLTYQCNYCQPVFGVEPFFKNTQHCIASHANREKAENKKNNHNSCQLRSPIVTRHDIDRLNPMS